MQNRTLKTILPGMPSTSARRRRAHGPEAAWRTARGIAAIFSLVVALLMLVDHLGADALDPLKSTELKALKEQLRANPADERSKEKIRELDLQVRARYFRRLSQGASGVYLLLGGAAIFVVSAVRCSRYRRQPPMPSPSTRPTDEPAQAAKLARWSVSGAGVAVGALLLVLGVGRETAVSERAAADNSLTSPQTGRTPATTD